MKRVRRKQILAEAEINLTPLVDVCFVILVMFIVVAPLLEMESIKLAAGPPLNEQSSIAIQDKSPITIYVFEDDTIAINTQKITSDQLKNILAIEKQKNPSAKPQLFHDRNAKFGTYQRVKNAVESVGFEEMDVILKPE